MLGLIAALISGIGAAAGATASAVGGLAAGVGGLAAGAAGLGVSAVSGLVGGIGSLLFGGPAPGMTIGEEMAAIAVPSYYETAGAGVLGGVASAASKTVGYLGDIMPAAVSAYQVIKPPEKIVPPSDKAVPAVPAPAITKPAVSAPAITKQTLPVLGAQPPVILETGMPAKPETNYILYIGLAILVLFLLRKK